MPVRTAKATRNKAGAAAGWRLEFANLSEVQRNFQRNAPPLSASATNFSLLGKNVWVRTFTFINHFECCDGHHPGGDCCPRGDNSVPAVAAAAR